MALETGESLSKVEERIGPIKGVKGAPDYKQYSIISPGTDGKGEYSMSTRLPRRLMFTEVRSYRMSLASRPLPGYLYNLA